MYNITYTTRSEGTMGFIRRHYFLRCVVQIPRHESTRVVRYEELFTQYLLSTGST